MKILYVLRQDPDETAKTFMEEQKKSNEVTVVDIREEKNYDRIIDLIAECDKVISW
jgi:hypothetical protein